MAVAPANAGGGAEVTCGGVALGVADTAAGATSGGALGAEGGCAGGTARSNTAAGACEGAASLADALGADILGEGPLEEPVDAEGTDTAAPGRANGVTLLPCDPAPGALATAAGDGAG